MSGKIISGDARFPHLPPNKVVVLKHWTLLSDDLINILHYRVKSVSTTNLIRHVTSTVTTKEVEILRRISWCEYS